MNDDRHAPNQEDRAAARIRETLPAPDEAAIERIAARIDSGAAPAARRYPRRRRMRGWTVRPAMVGGAVAVAAVIALLAPGDERGATPSLLTLGPDAAAADVLRAAGRQVGDAPWQPLAPGEYHYVRSTFESTSDPILRISERWTAADGTTVARELVDASPINGGDNFWMPAQPCGDFSMDRPLAIPSLTDTLEVGSTPPACWKSVGLHDPLLRAARGVVVDAPPLGAAVYVPPMLTGGPAHAAAARFGEDVRESDEPSDAPPGVAVVGPAGSAVRVQPLEQVPVATTWIEVRSEVFVAFETTTLPGTTLPDMPLALTTWPQVFTMDDLQSLPTTTPEMIDELRRAAERLSVPADATSLLPLDEQQQRRDAMVSLATELLASAPISPAVRQAAFEALAEIRGEQQPSTVLRDERLPDGRPAIGIRFELVQPKGYEHPDNENDHSILLLDAQTAQPVRSETAIGADRLTITWAPAERVDSVPSR
jgi:hypothetical protein